MSCLWRYQSLWVCALASAGTLFNVGPCPGHPPETPIDACLHVQLGPFSTIPDSSQLAIEFCLLCKALQKLVLPAVQQVR